MAFYSYEEMRSAGAKLKNEAANLQTLINTVTGIVSNLKESWDDVAQITFESQWNELLPKFKEFVPELESYSHAVNSHADKMEREGQTI